MDNYGGTTTGSTFIGANGFLDTDLTDDHPVSISYALDTELAPSTNPSGVGTTGNDIATDMLFAGNVECASCHDVHNKYGIASLLKKDNAASALCQTCHAK
jgi:predicted CXXCH cytochrome family protein